MPRRLAEVALDLAVAVAAYYFLGWIGFALWVFFVASWFGVQLVGYQRTMMQTLLSRLPDRCAFCHREIVDEGGIVDKDGIYHAACADKLQAPEGLRLEAGDDAGKQSHS